MRADTLGGKIAEITEIDMHVRFRQQRRAIAEIIAAAAFGFTFEQNLEARAFDLVAQRLQQFQRGQIGGL